MSISLVDIDTPTQFLIPRDGYDRPMVVPPEGGKPVAHTRTSTFIDAVEDKSSLNDWKMRSTLIAAALKPEILDEVRALDPYGTRRKDAADKKYKEQVDELVDKLWRVAGMNEKADKGTHLHNLSELVDQGKPLPPGTPEQDLMDMAAYRLATLIHGIKFTSSERFTVTPQIRAAGTPDRTCACPVPDPDGVVDDRVWDLKTGTLEYGGLKMATQEAIYSRAQFYDPTICKAPPYAKYVKKKDDSEGFAAWKRWKDWTETEFDAELAATAYSPIPPVNQKWGVILHLPAGTAQATLHWVDLEIGWEGAEQALATRATRSLKGKALVPFGSYT